MSTICLYKRIVLVIPYIFKLRAPILYDRESIMEDIVISGMSGKSSNSENLAEFRHQIYNKINMIREPVRLSRRPDCPERYGSIPKTNKFDNTFFSIPDNQANIMDPVNRMAMEVVCEALWDAGISLEEMKGSKTCITAGSCYSETEAKCGLVLTPNQNQFIGMTKTLLLDKIGLFLEIDGPTCGVDTACSSSIYCLEYAVRQLRAGTVDYAICTAHHLILSYGITQQFNALGVLSHFCACKAFNADAAGFARSDGLLTIILQRSKDAKRQYAKLVQVITSSDGFKERGITATSRNVQHVCLERFYNTVDVSADSIGYVECHGTGTKLGDPEELSSLETFFCKDRKDPLYIGSVKSNIGHCEGASGMSSVIKACWILDSNKIPPNIHYKIPNPEVNGIINGKLKVITEITELPDDKPYIAINNFGLGGASGHVLLTKPRRGVSESNIDDGVIRIVCLSGRTKEGVQSLYNDLKIRTFDPDFIALLNSSFGGKTEKLDHRGYCLASKRGYTDLISKEYTADTKPLTCFFLTSGLIGLLPELIKFKRFQKHIEEVENIFMVHKIESIFPHKSPTVKNEKELFTVVLQTGIIKLLREMNLDITSFIGHGIGELSAAYADAVLNLDQVILIAKHFSERRKTGKILTEDMTIAEIKKICTNMSPPRKWKVQQNDTTHENIVQYLAHAILNTKPPSVINENILIIGWNDLSKEHCITVSDASDNNSFLHAIGRLHLKSHYKNINKLFSTEWPVKAQTPMISPLIDWRHSKSWKDDVQTTDLLIEQTTIELSNPTWQYISGHNIDGRISFPATAYLRLVMKCFCPEMNYPIRLNNLAFHRMCTISEEYDLTLTVQILRTTGEFTVSDNASVIATGLINFEHNINEVWVNISPLPKPNDDDLMSKADFYKEIRIRGYFYQNHFKKIESCDINCTVGNIKWTDWAPFIDNILQMKIVSQDSRELFVPIAIGQILIDPIRHLDLIYDNGQIVNPVVPVYLYKDQDLVRSGYIEIRGFHTVSTSRRKNPEPVLEKYGFVPYFGCLDIVNVTKVLCQIAIENSPTIMAKIIEEFNDVPETMEPMLIYFEKCFHDIPSVQDELILYSKNEYQFDNIKVVDSKFKTDNFIAIGYNLSKNAELCSLLTSSIKQGGYLISREDINTDIHIEDMIVLCEYTTTKEKIAMLRMKTPIPKFIPIHIIDKEFEWIETLKNGVMNSKDKSILLYSENETSGILGLMKCLLRETMPEKIRSMFIRDAKAEKFELSADFYQKQLSKNLCINVLQNGTWGSYKYLSIDKNMKVESKHSYIHNTVRGDLSSLTWTQGIYSISDYVEENAEIVNIYSAGLNFKDILLVSGNIPLESSQPERIKQDRYLGLEFAGRRENGERVMGFVSSGALSNIIQVSKEFIWPFPENWSMNEAATIPAIYITNIYGLLMRAQLQEGESILIHSATGGIGLSAINIALYYKCNIFLTVGSDAKKNFILYNYPSIPSNHIGNSRDISFYELIMKYTQGKGVSIILNSQIGEKLYSSVRCLKSGGRFVELGKFACNKDSPLAIELSNKGAEYHGVMLDDVLRKTIPCTSVISEYLLNGIRTGFVKPIPYTEFNRDAIESAFRYMKTEKHVGKIVFKIQDDNINETTMSLPWQVRPKIYCDPRGSYIFVGGLGGVGLELIDFLILRGARNIIIVSRRGVTNGYQKLRIKLWKSYGCTIKLSQIDCSTKQGCQEIVDEAKSMADVMGFFNLAMVLHDGLLENQTKESFFESYIPKAQCTMYFNEITRSECPRLQYFVVFSTMATGRGNLGQTNYGYSNSVMEHICEERVAAGLPGKALQWGVIGDVGAAATLREDNTKIVIIGTTNQSIACCLESLDVLISSKDPIVSSMVIADKQNAVHEDDIISVISRLLSIKNINTVSPNATFPELGMDSMMAVEIRQTLERDFGLYLSPQELRQMQFSKLLESSNTKIDNKTDSEPKEPLIEFCAYENERS